MKRKKIAIIGPPGSGKTTISTGIFYFLKTLRKNAEIVPELVKFKLFKSNKFSELGFDITNTLEQKELEEAISNNKDIEFVICEAPLTNGYFYSSFYKKEFEVPVLKKIAQSYINSYDVVFFVKHQKDKAKYSEFGRNEDLSTSLSLEKHIDKELKKLNYNGKLFYIDQNTNIMDILFKILSL